MPVQFGVEIMARSFERAEKLAKGAMLLHTEADYIFIPIHNNGHFSLVTVNWFEKRMMHFDSSGSHASKPIFKNLKDFLVRLAAKTPSVVELNQRANWETVICRV